MINTAIFGPVLSANQFSAENVGSDTQTSSVGADIWNLGTKLFQSVASIVMIPITMIGNFFGFDGSTSLGSNGMKPEIPDDNQWDNKPFLHPGFLTFCRYSRRVLDIR